MSNELTDATKAAISQTIAKEILSGLSTEHRDALLTKSITEALTDYTFKHKICEVVVGRATEVARQMILEDWWLEKIRVEVRTAFNNFLDRLGGGLEEGLVEFFTGKEGGSYERAPGLLQKYLKKDQAAKPD